MIKHGLRLKNKMRWKRPRATKAIKSTVNNQSGQIFLPILCFSPILDNRLTNTPNKCVNIAPTLNIVNDELNVDGARRFKAAKNQGE